MQEDYNNLNLRISQWRGRVAKREIYREPSQVRDGEEAFAKITSELSDWKVDDVFFFLWKREDRTYSCKSGRLTVVILFLI